MSIRYHIVPRGEPGVTGGGTIQYYASAITSGYRGDEALIKQIERMSTVSGTDIRAVLYAMAVIVPEMLSEGFIVNLVDLGTFRITLSSAGSATEEEVSEENIRRTRVNFRPGPKFRDMQKIIKFERAEESTV